MLAGKTTDDHINRLLAKTHLIASPKLDGVRGLVTHSGLVSRTLKPIRNRYTQALFGIAALAGLDGELIVGDPTANDVYRKTNSAVMSMDGEPDVHFYAFDLHDRLPEASNYRERLFSLKRQLCRVNHPAVVLHSIRPITSMAELLAYEKDLLMQGYEGVILRRPDGWYKYGRSTENEGILLKLKRFEDSEATIIELVEQMHNANGANVNALGLTERSSHKENKAPMGTMGYMRVQDRVTGVTFKIGTGFTDEARSALWAARGGLKGAMVKYKYMSVGVKDKPRHPVFIGFRDVDDT